MLLHIPDILSADQVADFRRRLDAADWTDGRETVGHLGAQAKHNQHRHPRQQAGQRRTLAAHGGAHLAMDEWARAKRAQQAEVPKGLPAAAGINGA